MRRCASLCALVLDAEPVVTLNRLVHDVYDRAGYDLALDYQQPPPPPQMHAGELRRN